METEKNKGKTRNVLTRNRLELEHLEHVMVRGVVVRNHAKVQFVNSFVSWSCVSRIRQQLSVREACRRHLSLRGTYFNYAEITNKLAWKWSVKYSERKKMVEYGRERYYSSWSEIVMLENELPFTFLFKKFRIIGRKHEERKFS